MNYAYNWLMIIHDSTRTQDKVLKKATNLTLNTEVLAEAKKLGINISKACDAFLESLVRQEKERLWKLENADFIASYNKTIEDESLPLDSWRTF
ncbi:type II toxin-antitoxin system CcdA family antitoxin [Polynucleobacter sp. 31A-FELB]|uniref:type II toxin-antitoxin system CcdA family antitoxin n=1 Tax=Polynucleobacter sp. 31A-FELB TaxID=2689096 RepID=UPI0021038C3B|nr:type II toxin-antitoxin system CcdA family antitoxin [Polynucleobacter sp. 31A-FELB]